MAPGEVALANFPFGGSVGMKIRPVLVLTPPVGPVPETLVAYISSVIPNPLIPSDLLIDPTQAEFRITGLRAQSVIRLHKLAALHQQTFIKQLGRLPQSTLTEVRQKLRALLTI
ncbi:MAG TPA: type II toxin-antitoxin system PemK/MazF family toxin [Tepidisphaeraceae bacterium]|jgi:mRNA interferase MazF|nr:type II toxin-antitoxin system PemK/MazF family toxin [Tepidisphaeraceae bacterium]